MRTSVYMATARRLMNLAVVVRGRAYHPKRYMIETLAGALEDAAIVIQSTPVDEPGQLPQPAVDVLEEAQELLTGHDFMIPAAVIGYATAPITGRTPQLPPVHTGSECPSPASTPTSGPAASPSSSWATSARATTTCCAPPSPD